MRMKPWISVFIMVPFYTTSHANTLTEHPLINHLPPHTVVHYTHHESTNSNARSQDYPTQIIRMTANVDGQQLTCDNVNEEIEKNVLKPLSADKFNSTTLVGCTYDPQTRLATEYEINSFFDPINDEAIGYLNTYLDQYNGFNLMGTPLKIESAKGVVVALDFSAGKKKNQDTPPFIEYRHDHRDYFFKSNYELKQKLFNDVQNQFYSNDPQKIFPFLDKWIIKKSKSIYQAVLKDANYVELQPHRIFLMEKTGDIFVSKLNFYFAQSCLKYENQRCLNNEVT